MRSTFVIRIFLKLYIQVFELIIQDEYSSSMDENKMNFKKESTMKIHTSLAYHYPHPPIHSNISLAINPTQ